MTKRQEKKTPKGENEAYDNAMYDFIYGEVEDGKRVWKTKNQLLKKYKIGRDSFYRWAKEDGWEERRETQRRLEEKKVSEINAETIANRAANFDLMAMNFIESTIKRLQDRLDSAPTTGSHMRSSETHISTDEMNKMSSTFTNVYKNARLSLGMSTENNSIKGDFGDHVEFAKLVGDISLGESATTSGDEPDSMVEIQGEEETAQATDTQEG